ncbi:MAG: LytTR family transcriptional regulator DNA-binding domain-containing protein [Clostridia bacterium]|nr:LytTR family transcriptional regulator DNA-binding domain-containing protein [Clostridia bacterium]MBR3802057.1 LytTR family transcriptional regulator DNA-binding domain-containing protein [Clostridia bacterium]
MKITIEALADGAEEEIIIRTNTMDSDIINLIYAVKAGRNRITAFYENEIVQLDSKEVYYFESVDNKVYACCEKKVFEIKQKLYELEEIYKQTNFVRISKSMIVNISKVSKIVPMFNGRLEGVLCNGEKVIITRQYVANLKKKLGI